MKNFKKLSRNDLKVVQGGKLRPEKDMCTTGANDDCKAMGLECGLYVTREYYAMRCI
ncbi:bacteriocin-like protein [Elizabethkingia anophelis]|uniref:bacteriocin-like protein n=1 Tax=Elizabethkingia anophelis TaxID=1117645 RepID=UPI0012B41DBE|nr:hypothetical protein [Elizabethkingia anophelis]MCT3662687.1 hypothetical protein [Elizabethkingia anophelis]MCT3800752.1 hypothetical protein [Elizabethkingia anophelis]MCT3817088.1 hypothetical protein [Elizabethkingia anophelis]MCT3874391.1 hypothetical protein [Elizabethkingia anophelis]MCT4058159.1 hypothetical protein [Elizabethkingia anophelis]